MARSKHNTTRRGSHKVRKHQARVNLILDRKLAAAEAKLKAVEAKIPAQYEVSEAVEPSPLFLNAQHSTSTEEVA